MRKSAVTVRESATLLGRREYSSLCAAYRAVRGRLERSPEQDHINAFSAHALGVKSARYLRPYRAPRGNDIDTTVPQRTKLLQHFNTVPAGWVASLA